MESNNRNDMPAFMDTDLDPYTLVHDIVSNWWVIILWWHPEAMRMRTVI